MDRDGADGDRTNHRHGAGRERGRAGEGQGHGNQLTNQSRETTTSESGTMSSRYCPSGSTR